MCGFERIDSVLERLVERLAADAGRSIDRRFAGAPEERPAAKWKGKRRGPEAPAR